MKKIFSFLLVSAAVLAMAACQKEQQVNDAVDDSGVKEVTTQFVLNVAAKPQTKQTADVVQLNQNFRGIENAKIFCYNTGMSVSDGSVAPYVLNTAAPEAGKVKEFDLGLLMSENSISNGDKDSNSENDNLQNSSNRVLQLSIPVGVDAVLIYGKAKKPENGSDYVYGCTYDYDYNDSNKPNTVSSTPANTQFYAHPMLDEATTPKYDATAKAMIAVINDILNTSAPATESSTFGPTGNQVSFSDLAAVSWADYGHRYELDKLGDASRYTAAQSSLDHPVEGLEEVLGQCYYLFTYIKPSNVPGTLTPGSDEWKTYVNEHLGTVSPLGEYRSGSSFAVKKMIIDMYKIISAASDAIPTNVKEANAARLAKLILNNATKYFNTTDGTYKSVDVVQTNLGTKWNASWNGQVTDLNDHPGQFNIPEGAAQLGFYKVGDTRAAEYGGGTVTQDEFYYYHPNHPLVNPTMTEFEPRKYIYPAELWYYVNSPIRTTTTDVAVSDYPNGVTPWNTDASWSAWSPNSAVASATRGVAVTNSINYGVALLKSTVQTGSLTLKDNRAALTDETEDKVINVSDSHIKLTGILVGGVNPRMNWQFTRYYTAPGATEDLSKFDGVIFDSETGDPEITSTITNYTLVYDNYNSSESDTNQNDVFISLEFKNDGDAFWGRDNMIPSGGTFYLVGKLPKPNATQIAELASKWPADHQIPPVYGVNNEEVSSGHFKGESKKVARVFIQDFTTNVTFTIGQNSLKNAYYSVPDLRASQMSLGLSVDVQWISGLNYNVNL